MLGLSKSFVIVLIISLLIGFGAKDWKAALTLFGIYAVIKVVWNFLTK